MARSQAVTVLARKAPSYISIAVAPSEGEIPLTVTITGVLTDKTGKGLAFRTVDLYVNSALIGSTTTAANGSYGLQASFEEPGSYTVETEFPGDSRYAGCLENANVQAGVIPVVPVVPSLVPLLALGGGVALTLILLS